MGGHIFLFLSGKEEAAPGRNLLLLLEKERTLCARNFFPRPKKEENTVARNLLPLVEKEKLSFEHNFLLRSKKEEATFERSSPPAPPKVRRDK